MVIILNFDR